MLVCDYRVMRIDGDYAGLMKLDESGGAVGEELNFVARALLPDNIYEGCKLHCEMMMYTIVEE